MPFLVLLVLETPADSGANYYCPNDDTVNWSPVAPVPLGHSRTGVLTAPSRECT